MKKDELSDLEGAQLAKVLMRMARILYAAIGRDDAEMLVAFEEAGKILAEERRRRFKLRLAQKSRP